MKGNEQTVKCLQDKTVTVDSTNNKNSLSALGGVALFFAFLVVGFSAQAQSGKPVSQLQPVTSKGSGVFEMAPPSGEMLPQDMPVGERPPMGQKPPKGKMPQMNKGQKHEPMFPEANTSNIKTKYLDVPYGSVSKTQTMDIYLPNEGTGPFPIIVDIHGGAFMIMNSRSAIEGEIINAGAERGYVVASINYRLSGEARFPRAVNDSKAAIRFLKANAQKYNIDTNRIVVWGGSAGGNLSAMVGTTGNVPDLNGDNLENLGYSSGVKVVVDWFGPCDFLKYDDQFKASGVHTPYKSVLSDDSPESLYLGQNVAKDPTFTQRANPMTYIGTLNKQTAPFFIIQHGSADQNIPTQQSVDFSNALKNQIGAEKVYFEIIPGAHHGDPAFTTSENLAKVFDLLSKNLK